MATTLTGPSSAIVISRNLDPSSRYWLNRLNHKMLQTVSGNVVTYDAGPSMLHGVLVWKFVSRSEARALSAWISDELRFTLKPFSISSNSWDDLGLGLGAAIDAAKLDDTTSTKDIIVPRNRAGKFDVTLPYVCKMTSASAVGEI